MSETKSSLLIVDDDNAIRTALSCLFTEIGYSVRTAEDGFSALAAMRKDIPNILLSDLNMPGMSGFELLSVVRHRFPAIRTVAMSGSFRGTEVPPGVAADRFYEKGSNLGPLLSIMEALPQMKRGGSQPPPCRGSSIDSSERRGSVRRGTCRDCVPRVS
jgi:CheY-like chemotaxis protein